MILLRVPWTARSNQPILKETGPEYSLEGTMLKLKLQHFGHLMQRTDSLEKTQILGKVEGLGNKEDDRGWDGWMASLTQWTWVWAISGSWWWTGKPGMLESIGLQRVGHNWVTELNWTMSRNWKLKGKVRTIAELGSELRFSSLTDELVMGREACWRWHTDIDRVALTPLIWFCSLQGA